MVSKNRFSSSLRRKPRPRLPSLTRTIGAVAVDVEAVADDARERVRLPLLPSLQPRHQFRHPCLIASRSRLHFLERLRR